MSQLPAEIRKVGAWESIAQADGREWFREHPGAPLDEFFDWIQDEYEPQAARNCDRRYWLAVRAEVASGLSAARRAEHLRRRARRVA